MRTWLSWRRSYNLTALAKLHLQDWLNLLLVGGLILFNLVALGFAYWVATRDVVAEFAGEMHNAGVQARTVRERKPDHVPLPLPQPRPNVPIPPLSADFNRSRFPEANDSLRMATTEDESPALLTSPGSTTAPRTDHGQESRRTVETP